MISVCKFDVHPFDNAGAPRYFGQASLIAAYQPPTGGMRLAGVGESLAQTLLQFGHWQLQLDGQVLTIRRENGGEPDTRTPRARPCPSVRCFFVPRFGTAVELVCLDRRRHLAGRPHRLVDRVERLGTKRHGSAAELQASAMDQPSPSFEVWRFAGKCCI
jgi:hypothetical protein